MIVEVSNTFDERRIYLLQPQLSTLSLEKELNSSLAIKFTGNWAKNFHVSPFNPREGRYTLVANDIRPFEESANSRVSNNITLISSHGHPKLNARMFSTSPPLDPAALSINQFFQLLLQRSWIGSLTFPRILRQAWRLYFQVNLPVWCRPEVTGDSISRRRTKSEKLGTKSIAPWSRTLINVYL